MSLRRRCIIAVIGSLLILEMLEGLHGLLPDSWRQGEMNQVLMEVVVFLPFLVGSALYAYLTRRHGPSVNCPECDDEIRRLTTRRCPSCGEDVMPSWFPGAIVPAIAGLFAFAFIGVALGLIVSLSRLQIDKVPAAIGPIWLLLAATVGFAVNILWFARSYRPYERHHHRWTRPSDMLWASIVVTIVFFGLLYFFRDAHHEDTLFMSSFEIPFLVALLSAFYSLRRRRERRRGEYMGRLTEMARTGKCAACGYDLTGNTSGRCPECGERLPLARAIDPARPKFKTSSSNPEESSPDRR
jgi:MFS family permease